MMSLNIPKTTCTELDGLEELGLKGEAFTLCKPEEIPLVESIEKLLGNPLPRKFLDHFAYRDQPETLTPSAPVVSRKRNRGFGKQVSFGSRRRR